MPFSPALSFSADFFAYLLIGSLIIPSSVFVIPINCDNSSRLAFISLFSISLTISLSLSPLLVEAQRPQPVHSHSLAILPRYLAVHQTMAPYPLPFKSNKLILYLRYNHQHERVTMKVAPQSFNLVAGSRAVTMLAAAPVELRAVPLETQFSRREAKDDRVRQKPPRQLGTSAEITMIRENTWKLRQ
jgi:hypothetical protein